MKHDSAPLPPIWGEARLRLNSAPQPPILGEARLHTRRILPPRLGGWGGLLLLIAWLLTACSASTLSQPETTTPGKAVTSATTDHPTLTDFWRGDAHFEIEVADTGLPMGESDTLPVGGDELWSYLHASYQSAGVVDQCGDPVPFPGCVVIFQSRDRGLTFAPLATGDATTSPPLTCQIPCAQCPCDSRRDQIDQQQYPQVVHQVDADGRERWVMAYEYRANTMLRRSADGLTWSPAEEAPFTGIWQEWLMSCREEERIGPHPNAPAEYDCLVGGPPGVVLAANERGETELYLFVGLGQNPGSMGCYRGSPGAPAAILRKCDHNPLFTGARDYGPVDASGADANAYFDFRTISSADVIRVDDRYYMLYEGVRGPTAGDAGDTQFGLGLARSLTDQIDGPWERYPGNPILADVPANVGIGHADLVVLDGQTILYTSLDGETRSRLKLVW